MWHECTAIDFVGVKYRLSIRVLFSLGCEEIASCSIFHPSNGKVE
jgi:hypothetical protein